MHVKVIIMGLAFCSTFMFLSGCINQHKPDINENRKIVLSLGEMLLYPEHLRDTVFCPKFKYVVYVDSTECSPCKIAHLGIWNYFKNELEDNNAGLFIILFPSRDNVLDIQEVHETYKHRIPIYIDTLGVFERENPQIAKMTTEYHSFLLDKDNTIVAFGDASTNLHVRDEIFRILSEDADSIITESKP